jgi:hypothetical protein
VRLCSLSEGRECMAKCVRHSILKSAVHCVRFLPSELMRHSAASVLTSLVGVSRRCAALHRWRFQTLCNLRYSASDIDSRSFLHQFKNCPVQCTLPVGDPFFPRDSHGNELSKLLQRCESHDASGTMAQFEFINAELFVSKAFTTAMKSKTY